MRLTVTEGVHYEGPEIPGVLSHNSAYTRPLQGKEQAYQRIAPVDVEWEPLGLGWIREARMVCLQNTSKDGELLLGVDGLPCLRILPGESCRFQPAAGVEVQIRAVLHGSSMRLTVIPS